MRLITSVSVILLTFYSIIEVNAQFTNTVDYPQVSADNVYKFDLTFSEGLSMSINQKKDGEFDPVDFNTTDGKFYVKDKNLFHACHIGSLVTDKHELDTLVTVDGRHRTMIFVNDQFPGPPIVVPKGAQLEITVVNHLRAEILSIHWHGQTQMNSFQVSYIC